MLGEVHNKLVFGRRVRRLAAALTERLPHGARVLDVGCGSGDLAALILSQRPDLHIEGLDVLVRPGTAIRWPGTRRTEREPCPAVPDPSTMPEPTDQLTECRHQSGRQDQQTDHQKRADRRRPPGVVGRTRRDQERGAWRRPRGQDGHLPPQGERQRTDAHPQA